MSPYDQMATRAGGSESSESWVRVRWPAGSALSIDSVQSCFEASDGCQASFNPLSSGVSCLTHK